MQNRIPYQQHNAFMNLPTMNTYYVIRFTRLTEGAFMQEQNFTSPLCNNYIDISKIFKQIIVTKRLVKELVQGNTRKQTGHINDIVIIFALLKTV